MKDIIKEIKDELWREMDEAEFDSEKNLRYYEAYNAGLEKAMEIIEVIERRMDK